jgi:hypothetical protein
VVTKAKGPPEPTVVSKVVDKSPVKPEMKALTPEDIAGDCSVDDFIKWVENFGTQSGHFVSEEAALDFARQVRTYIEIDGYIGEVPSANKQKRIRG